MDSPQSTFIQLVSAHQGLIYKLVNLYAFNEDDRKDYYQDIVLQAWKSYPSFEGRAKFSTWLYRIAINTILTRFNKKDVIASTDLVPDLASSDVAVQDEKQRRYQAIRTLPKTDRAIISLHLDGYDNQEIASMIGISANNAGVKLHRIRQNLARLLKKI